MLKKKQIAQLSEEFEAKTPQEILTWAIDEFWPQIAMSSSFQTQSMPLLHMATQIRRDLLIFFLDTGYHFWDTLIFRERIASEWKLNVLDLYRDSRWDVFARQHTQFTGGRPGPVLFPAQGPAHAEGTERPERLDQRYPP
jgi:phosphoadenosine phosphosulfate reductase